jgi:hypothetical protein
VKVTAIHISDPSALFLRIDRFNESWEELRAPELVLRQGLPATTHGEEIYRQVSGSRHVLPGYISPTKLSSGLRARSSRRSIRRVSFIESSLTVVRPTAVIPSITGPQKRK